MSTHRAALIAAILERPDDDDVRLVCADWFEDQGDEASVARAEFIRIQIERARLPVTDLRHSELQARELRLLKRYGSAWCGSHFVFKKVRFRRGFIEYVHLHLRHFQHHRRQMLALEPVRDVSLTGWLRAPTDLLRRVAGCEEWRHIDRLRIHHQGPHKDPGNDVLLLLESPHLSRLRALHCPLMVLDVHGRRRFERLPILRQLTDLRFPTLDTLMEKPGEWFSDGSSTMQTPWEKLTSLQLPYYLRNNVLRRFTELPFWNRLTALELVIPYETSEGLELLRDRIPASLRLLHLHASAVPADYSAAGPVFERLAQRPLQTLSLHSIAISRAMLEPLIDSASRCDLRSLSLPGCDINDEQIAMLADAPGMKNLHSLNLSHWNIGVEAARSLFSSEHLRSLVQLQLANTQIGTEGATALARAEGWDRLRALDLESSHVTASGLQALLRSPNLRRLNSLSVGGGGYPNPPALVIGADVAADFLALPHLARLHLGAHECDPSTRQILLENERKAWVSGLNPCDDVQSYRESLAPERSPPLDSEFDGQHGLAPE